MNVCDDSDVVSVSGVSVKVLGQSGKLVITKNITNGNTTTEESVTVNFSSLIERDNEGNEVGQSGQVKHSFNNFAQLNFTVSNFTEEKYQNLTVFKTSLTASEIVAADTNFTGTFYVFTEGGDIQTGKNETTKVAPGAVKFSVDVNNWPFCQSHNETDACEEPTCCQKGQDFEVGSYLDFDLQIKGGISANNTGNNTYDLGNSHFILSQYVLLDEEQLYTQLPDNYPAYSKQGETDVFTFRFPRFSKSLSYDPVVIMNSGDQSSSSNIWLVVGIFVGIILLAIVVFMVVKCFKSERKQDQLMA